MFDTFPTFLILVRNARRIWRTTDYFYGKLSTRSYAGQSQDKPKISEDPTHNPIYEWIINRMALAIAGIIQEAQEIQGQYNTPPTPSSHTQEHSLINYCYQRLGCSVSVIFHNNLKWQVGRIYYGAPRHHTWTTWIPGFFTMPKIKMSASASPNVYRQEPS